MCNLLKILVDKYIVKLDRDTEKFNIYAKRKMGENSNLHKVSFEPNKSGNKKRRFDSTSSTTEGKRSMKKNKMTLSVMESEEPATSSVFLGPISGDVGSYLLQINTHSLCQKRKLHSLTLFPNSKYSEV